VAPTILPVSVIEVQGTLTVLKISGFYVTLSNMKEIGFNCLYRVISEKKLTQKVIKQIVGATWSMYHAARIHDKGQKQIANCVSREL
jgi:hypothetical protein